MVHVLMQPFHHVPVHHGFVGRILGVPAFTKYYRIFVGLEVDIAKMNINN